jgi:hypothetical protein
MGLDEKINSVIVRVHYMVERIRACFDLSLSSDRQICGPYLVPWDPGQDAGQCSHTADGTHLLLRAAIPAFVRSTGDHTEAQ